MTQMAYQTERHKAQGDMSLDTGRGPMIDRTYLQVYVKLYIIKSVFAMRKLSSIRYNPRYRANNSMAGMFWRLVITPCNPSQRAWVRVSHCDISINSGCLFLIILFPVIIVWVSGINLLHNPFPSLFKTLGFPQ